MGKILGLDVGIGSLGWAVVDEDNHRIVDLGVRIFESGELKENNVAKKASQIRRSKRAVRRLNKRSKHRKLRLKEYLERSGIITVEEINEAYRTKGFNPDVWRFRSEGLNRKLEPIEIAAILINMANYRGYKDFYDDSDDKDSGKLAEAKNKIINIYEEKKNQYRTIGQMIYEDSIFRDPNSGKLVIRNRNITGSDGKKVTNYEYLISRTYLENEVDVLLNVQREFGYEVFTPDCIAEIKNIIFHQRDFEDGPGPRKGERDIQRDAMMQSLKGHQTYSGFDELVGYCPFYPLEKRGHKNSQLYDMYVLVNTLSQFSFYLNDKECTCPESIINEIRLSLFKEKGTLTIKKFKAICEKSGITVVVPPKLEKKKNLATSPFIKLITNEDYFSEELISRFSSEDILDDESLSSKIGKILAQYATPRRRHDELKAILGEENFRDINYAKNLKNVKAGGGANVSFKYMRAAIEAYYSGEKYGDFQARFNEENPEENKRTLISDKGKLLPITDPDMVRNPVVYRSLNEARRIINAVMSEYSGITKINVEVARDVGKSFAQRAEIAKYQSQNESANEEIRNELVAKLSAEGLNVALSDKLIEKYTLWKSQKQKCMYSGEPISFRMLLSTTEIQVDHIIPQSKILDETMNNKVLVFTKENQAKGDDVPLRYMTKEQAEIFKNNVINLYRTGNISRAKKEYLLIEYLTDEVVSGFVDRNINDTRTISKYIANYLKLAFGNSIEILVLKGSVTSRFRKRWLGSRYKKYDYLPSVYGLEKKTRDLHYYHHAIDAVVIANLTRPYIEIAQDYLKIESIRRDYKRALRDNHVQLAERLQSDINNEREKAIDKMSEYYGFKKEYTANLLDKGFIPSICYSIRDEIEARIPLNIDVDLRSYQRMCDDIRRLRSLVGAIKLNYKNSELTEIDDEILEEVNSLISNTDIKQLVSKKNAQLVCMKKNAQLVYEDDSDEECSPEQVDKNLSDLMKKLVEPDIRSYVRSIDMLTEEEYSERVHNYYKSDSSFADSVKLPYVSFKIDRKFRGEMTMSDNPVSFDTVCKHLEIRTYKELENKMLNDPNCPYYIRFNRGIGEDSNFTIYEANSYYCVEIFIDDKNNQKIRGIRYVDVVLDKKTGKMILKKPLPANYTHCMYLFKNEYIRVTQKGSVINNGFGAYRSVKNINRDAVYIRLYSNSESIINLGYTCLQKNGLKKECHKEECNKKGCHKKECHKIELSILGHLIGEIKCGDQSLFTTVRD